MSRAMRIYYFAVLGAIGGLLAWQTSNYLGLSFFSNLYLSELGVGALIGFLIGGCIGLTDGLVNGNLQQMWQSGLASGLLGMAQTAARYWLHSPAPISQESAAKAMSMLSWRGISEFPLTHPPS